MKLRILICLAALLPGTVWLTGCASIGDQIKDEFSSYAEPKEGELAHIRLIGSRQVKVYPNSTCVNPGAPGSGYPNGWQMYGQRKRDLGMPKLPQTPRHYIEIAARAAQPITAAFSFQTSLFPQKHRGAAAAMSSTSTSATLHIALCPWQVPITKWLHVKTAAFAVWTSRN